MSDVILDRAVSTIADQIVDRMLAEYPDPREPDNRECAILEYLEEVTKQLEAEVKRVRNTKEMINRTQFWAKRGMKFAQERDINGEIYLKCDTIDDLTRQVIMMGYTNLAQFEKETGATPDSLLNRWWILLQGRVYIMNLYE